MNYFLNYPFQIHCLGYANSGSLYHAGKQLEQALFISKEQNDLSQVKKIFFFLIGLGINIVHQQESCFTPFDLV